jgi:hypothetical protein
MRRSIPVSLVAIDNVAHRFTARALLECLLRVDPKQVLILTDDPSKIRVPGAEYRPFDGDLLGVVRALWYEVPSLLRASHFIWVQWDSWILDEFCWTDTFLDYDYVGCPSDWGGNRKELSVGGGGFSLRSYNLARRLGNFVPTINEDFVICLELRSALEREGFTWASLDLAARYAIGTGQPPPGGVFGYHSCYNWLNILPREEREDLFRVAPPYVRNHRHFKHMMEFHRAYPEI